MISDDQKKNLKRIMHYCALAERCTQEVVQKLTSWNVPAAEMEAILEKLKLDNFLDDTRFLNSYVADKWKLDQWGRGKIRNGLFQKGFNETQIQTALDNIDQDIYVAGMEMLLTRKRETILAEKPVSQMKKILSYGYSRGFEEELIWQWLEKQGLSFDADISSDDEESF